VFKAGLLKVIRVKKLISNETVVLRRWGSETREFGFSVNYHRKQIPKLTFRALALRQRLETSAFKFLYGA